MSDEQSPSYSDEEEELAGQCLLQQPELCGTLHKWTNYIHGWQDRHIVLRDGTLSYYKSEHDLAYGCRGAMSIAKATVKPHEFDECRFDVSMNDCVWYLRCESPDDKQRWVESLEAYKSESGYGSENNLRRHGSAISLTSNTLSTASSSSFKKGHGLREKLAEMETFRDILCRQVDTLQSYFDACTEAAAAISAGAFVANSEAEGGGVCPRANGEPPPNSTACLDEECPEHSDSFFPHKKRVPTRPHPHSSVTADVVLRHGAANAVDFKGEAITFKATTAGVLATLQHCMDLMGQREDGWRRRLDKEVERRRKTEDLLQRAVQEGKRARSDAKQVVVVGGPDYEEGPHSSIKEEEFFDAVEMGLDKMEEEVELRERLKSLSTAPVRPTGQPPSPNLALTTKVSTHALWPEIQRVTMQQLHYARLGVGNGEGDGEGVWGLFAEDGEMRMYKREEEINGMVVDPLKAVHTVKGVTGREMCYYFFTPEVRMEWETTVEQVSVVETVSEDTLVFHQVHKRVWPASQRDSLFWSHIRRVPDDKDEDAHDIWIVCNQSTDAPDAQVNSSKYVRVFLTVCLVCHTFIDPPKDGAPIGRDDLTCKITYCSVVNPGGWAPASVLRAVYKREYPKFLKRFTQYVIDQCKDKPIKF